MIELNEPQVWMLIGVFGTALFGMLTFMSTSLVRMLHAKFEAVDSRFEAVQVQFQAVQTQFETVHVKLDHLDRDVQALVRRVFPEHD